MSDGQMNNAGALHTLSVEVSPLTANRSRNVSMAILSGLLAQKKFLWPNAAPIEFSFELDDATANLFNPVAGTKSTSWQIQNCYIIADVVEMDSALLNK